MGQSTMAWLIWFVTALGQSTMTQMSCFVVRQTRGHQFIAGGLFVVVRTPTSGFPHALGVVKTFLIRL